jgi:sarcosine oxidase/L-pipecolate oxidase
MSSWHHDPLFSPFYHETGFIMAAATPTGYRSCLEYRESEDAELVPLEGKEFRATMPEGVLTGDFAGWKGFWKKKGAGWVEASKVLTAMYDEACKLGVNFICGQKIGRVEKLLYSDSIASLLGAITIDGKQHTADTVVLAAGANSAQLFAFEHQLLPKAWTLAHIPLPASEARIYKDLPVLYACDRGFFIEPQHPTIKVEDEDGETKYEIKICDEHPGYINPVTVDPSNPTTSVPFAKHQIPMEAEERMRLMLRETMPHLSTRPFSFARICWDADTPDRMFLIDRHPKWENLVVAVGGSGNGFMCCPAIGPIVADIVEKKNSEEGFVGERVRKILRWRPETAVGRDIWDTQGRHGADEKVMDLREVTGWTSIGE